MLVRLMGFGIERGSAIPLAEVIASIAAKQGAQDPAQSPRLIYLNSDADAEYHLGLIVTIRDQRQFCKLQKNKGEALKVTVAEVGDGARIMEFNFFVINKTNQLGLYQHYHQSCSVGAAMSMFRKEHIGLRELRIAEAARAAPAEQREAATKRARKALKKPLDWHFLVRKEDLRKILSEMKRIKSFELDFVALAPEESVFRPLSGYVKKERKKVSFKSGSPVERLAPAIADIVSKSNSTRGHIGVVDSDDHEQMLRIVDIPEAFGEYNYDDVAPKINDLSVDDFHNSWVIKQLLNVCKKGQVPTFGAKLK